MEAWAPPPPCLSLLPPALLVSHPTLESPHPPGGLWSLLGFSPRCPPSLPHSVRPRCTLRSQAVLGGGLSGTCPPRPWRPVGSVMSASVESRARTGWEAREVALYPSPEEVGQLSPPGSPPGRTEREETPAGGPRLPPRSHPGAHHPVAQRVATLTIHRGGEGRVWRVWTPAWHQSPGQAAMGG